MSKYQLKCSCNICHIETTVQSLSAHIQTHKPKTFCLQCNAPLYISKQFCSRSCSATYHNARKDYTKFKSGPKPLDIAKQPYKPKHMGFNRRDQAAYTKVTQCIICGKYHAGFSKSCSTGCKSVLLSQRMKESIKNGFDPRSNRGRGKQSYLERSFSSWLNSNFSQVMVVMEQPFKRNDITKTYFIDFYFPSLQLGIELDGSQHKDTTEYDIDRDTYLTNEYGIHILRITHQEYRTKTKLHLVQSILEQVNGFGPSSLASEIPS